MTEQDYMALAISLAKNGIGHVNPNPLVGAVIVKDGQIIGQGWHAQFGGLHAERNALADCSQSPAGATLYVNLEPCCHWGKTPPCTDAILESGIRRVVIGSTDPNPLMRGKGIAVLQKAGLIVETGLLQAECDRLNEVFFHYIQSGTPFVVMKYAMTMDGKIAAYTGKSQWITGEPARRHVHHSRNRYAAIMVGIGTVLRDDPLLTCRLPGGRNPIRIICDSRLRIPTDSQIMHTAKEIPTILAVCSDSLANPALQNKQAQLQAAGCRLLGLPEADGQISLPALMEELGKQAIDSVLLEGGGTLNWSALKSGIVHKIQAYVAPLLLCGRDAGSPIAGQGFPSPDDGIHLTPPRVLTFGSDILLESEVLPCSPA